MIFRINLLSPILVLPLLMTLPTSPASAQRQKKTDKLLFTNLDTHVRYLSNEKLEGRRTGTPGEKQASDYIAVALSNAGLVPKGDKNGWLQAFNIDQGRVVSPDAFFIVNDHPLLLNKEYFPLAFSAVGSVSGSPAIALQESGVPWFLDLRDLLESDGGARVSLPAAIREKAAEFAKKGATALIVYNSSKMQDNLCFDPNDRTERATIPILYITAAAKRKYLKDESASVDLRIKTGFSEKKCTGHNIVGYVDNGSSSTVVIGAHYDHWTEAADSVSSRNTPRGDNVCGVAAMIELARLLASSRLKGNNYLFVAFSGGEQGSAGSAFLAGHLPFDPRRLNYMLDLDAPDPANGNAGPLVVGGCASSPAWAGAAREIREKPAFSVRLDSGYAGPGDQTAFYSKGVPVLVFYIGGDWTEHKPEVVKYLFDMVKAVDRHGRLAYTKTGS
ncbi:MAG TPA: M28 family peptidase [Puia sp.]|nr:M28 family peptidase [Puia sp.]